MASLFGGGGGGGVGGGAGSGALLLMWVDFGALICLTFLYTNIPSLLIV